jgi:hypothetical protein
MSFMVAVWRSHFSLASTQKVSSPAAMWHRPIVFAPEGSPLDRCLFVNNLG